MELCPCGTQKAYSECCEPYILGKAAPTPELLMRSRYTAYTKAHVDYIHKTMAGKIHRAFNAKDAKQWAVTSEWQSMEIVEAPAPEGDVGFVSFIVKYVCDNVPQTLHETSEFHKIDDRWYYVKEHPFKNIQKPAVSASKQGRNDPCSCGSEKKYKKCCGLAKA